MPVPRSSLSLSNSRILQLLSLSGGLYSSASSPTSGVWMYTCSWGGCGYTRPCPHPNPSLSLSIPHPPHFNPNPHAQIQWITVIQWITTEKIRMWRRNRQRWSCSARSACAACWRRWMLQMAEMWSHGKQNENDDHHQLYVDSRSEHRRRACCLHGRVLQLG